jgi:hypothetical protein
VTGAGLLGPQISGASINDPVSNAAYCITKDKTYGRVPRKTGVASMPQIGINPITLIDHQIIDARRCLHSDYAYEVRSGSPMRAVEDERYGVRRYIGYRIYWFISPPYVARARQIPSLKGGLIAKGGL